MKVSYHRDLNKNYLILSELEITGKEYTLKMLAGNNIPGFLALSIRNVNGEYRLFYEITSKISLAAAYETKQIDRRGLENLTGSVGEALRQAERYLIGTENISLDPELLFMDPDTGRVSVLLLPGLAESGKGRTQAQMLAEFILRHLNHADREAVDMGYEFYRMAMEGRFSFEAMEDAVHIRKNREEVRTENYFDRYSEEDFGDEGEPVGQTEETGEKTETKAARKKRKQMEESTDARNRRKILIWVGIVLAAAAVYVLILLLFKLDLTQAGGLAFLMLAVGWLITDTVTRKKREGKNHWSDEVEDEDDLMDALLEELYDQETRENEEKAGGSGEYPGTQTSPGKTRALIADDGDSGFVLASLDPRRSRNINLGSSVTIGKSPDLAQEVIDNDAVSRIHARVECSGEEISITDLNSMNGVTVNGKTITPMVPCALQEDDLVAIADLKYRVRRKNK